MFPLIALGVIVAVVFVQEGQRKIPIQYAKRMVGRRMTTGGSTYMPLRVNMAGVIPVIFAAAVMAFPPTIGTFFPQTQGFVNNYFTPNNFPYLIFQAVLIVIFTYFYTAVQFNPVDQADNLRKHGGYIPGIRPGPPTAQYLDRVLTRLTLPGALYLAVVATLPVALHRLRRLLAGDGRRAGRNLGPDRGRRRARHHAADGVADDDALLRRVLALSLNVLLLGIQGSGKGTQAKRIAAEYEIPHIATGDLLRGAIAARTPLGVQVEEILERGDLVPDETMIHLIRGQLERADAGFVLDGFPRTMEQADALDEMLDEDRQAADDRLRAPGPGRRRPHATPPAGDRRRPRRRHARGDRPPDPALPP